MWQRGQAKRYLRKDDWTWQRPWRPGSSIQKRQILWNWGDLFSVSTQDFYLCYYCGIFLTFSWYPLGFGFPDGASGKEPACQCRRHKRWVQSLGEEDSLEEGMAMHSSILAWRITMDRGAWQAAVHGFAQSRTRLQRLSTHVYHCR